MTLDTVIIQLLVLLSVLVCIQSEVFTSMANMENLVHTEKSLLAPFKEYIEAEEEKLAFMKSFMLQVNDVHSVINESGIDKYLGNPVNVYLMLRRMSIQWKQLKKFMKEDTEQAQDFSAIFDDASETLPNQEDHEGAMTALFRLQDTYNLPSSKLAKGVIPGVTGIFSQPLDIREIYDLGRHAYDSSDWVHARDWMRTALNTMTENENTTESDRANILDYLAFSEFKHGNVKEAFVLTHELAQLLPKEGRILDNLEHYRQELRKLDVGRKRGDTGTIDDAELYQKIRKEGTIGSETEATNKRNYLKNYEKLCRGEVRQQTRKELKKMFCWYKSTDPLLILKPQKVERIWASPELFLFHDILTDHQVELIKETAYPILRRATIQDPITGKLRAADYRVSKSAWLASTEHEFVRQMEMRAQAVTNLDMRSAEQLQIANYGIGGHYEPHFDHAREDEDKFTDLGIGNRIATLLFYLSDVEAGGATVFTVGKTAVFPKKRDAVFWFNLKKNGIGNPNTRHAACPVLVGQKWVSNWWIHEARQEFRRPCSLNSSN